MAKAYKQTNGGIFLLFYHYCTNKQMGEYFFFSTKLICFFLVTSTICYFYFRYAHANRKMTKRGNTANEHEKAKKQKQFLFNRWLAVTMDYYYTCIPLHMILLRIVHYISPKPMETNKLVSNQNVLFLCCLSTYRTIVKQREYKNLAIVLT